MFKALPDKEVLVMGRWPKRIFMRTFFPFMIWRQNLMQNHYRLFKKPEEVFDELGI